MNTEEVINIVDELGRAYCRSKNCNTCLMHNKGEQCQIVAVIRHLEGLEDNK